MTAAPPKPSSVSEPASCRPSVAVWSWPIALGALTVFGLFSALLGQHGVWLALSWIALSLPPIVTVICLCRAWSRTPYTKGGQS